MNSFFYRKKKKTSQLVDVASIASLSLRVTSLAAAASASSFRAKQTSVTGVRTPFDASDAARERAEASSTALSLRPESVVTSNDDSGG